MIGRFLGPQFPAGVTAMTLLVSRCGERDLALSLELATDLPMERGLIRFDGQGADGALLEAPAAKNACVVGSASAWMSFPSRSIMHNSSLSAARSLDSGVS